MKLWKIQMEVQLPKNMYKIIDIIQVYDKNNKPFKIHRIRENK